MKFFKIILLLLTTTFISSAIYDQTISASDLNTTTRPKGTFQKYIAADGEEYSVGDTLQINTPSGTNGKFVFITKLDIAGNVYTIGSEAVNTSAVIKKIRISGTKRSGWKASFQTQGFTAIDNYFLNIEDAIKSKEVKGKGMTSDEALIELKKAKDKLDLELITESEYNEIKEKLKKYIK